MTFIVDKNATAASTGKVRRSLLVAMVILVVIIGFHIKVVEPYAVTHRGDCVFEIQPTGWNGEEVLPCGTLLTRFSISEEVYLAKR